MSYTCVEPGCDEPTRSNRGVYARCEYHRRVREAQAPAQPQATGTLVAALDRLKTLAKAADKARAAAEKLTRSALAAKAKADEADRAFREAMAELQEEPE